MKLSIIVGFIEFGAIFIYIYSVVINYTIFEKCNEKGWKAIIPLYNKYKEFKLYWNWKYLIILYLLANALSLLMYWVSLIYLGGLFTDFMLVMFVIVLTLAVTVIYLSIIIRFRIYQARSFGKSTLFGLGLFFLYFIFGSVLAYGDSKYLGNTYLQNKNDKESYV